MSEQRAQATTGGADDPERTRALDVGDGATVDLQKPDDGPWRTAPLDAGAAAAPATTAGTSAATDEGGRTATASDADPPRTSPASRSTLPRTSGGPERVKRPAAPAGGSGGGRARRARLRLARIDPWSVLLLSLLVSLFLAVVVVVAVVALYAVLEAAGVPDSVNALAAEVTRTPGEAEPEPLLSAGRALRAAGIIAVVDVVLVTALATLSAVLYNLCASFTGGLEVTLAEDS